MNLTDLDDSIRSADLDRLRKSVAEVSKATLDRYVPKAVDAHGHADFGARMSKDDPTKRSYHVDQKRTAEKRRQGISRALDRMSKVAEGMYAGTDDTVGFSVNSERAHQAVMARFGDHVDHDETSGIMYVPARMWPQVEMVAFDADGEGAVQADDLDEGEKVGNMDADAFDAAMARLKQLAKQGPMKTVWDPVKRVYKNVPVNKK